MTFLVLFCLNADVVGVVLVCGFGIVVVVVLLLLVVKIEETAVPVPETSERGGDCRSICWWLFTSHNLASIGESTAEPNRGDGRCGLAVTSSIRRSLLLAIISPNPR